VVSPPKERLPKERLPKERLIETARDLFTAQGVPRVGINEVIQTAKVARMTLYNNFTSKDDLTLAAFEREAEIRRESITSAQAILETPLDKVLALFEIAAELAEREKFRGCSFINLAIETASPDSELHNLARRHKGWIRDNIVSQLKAGHYENFSILADQILILWDGSVVGAYIQQSTAPIITARNATSSLILGAAD
jgi:AcrR family transcriptional regulator